MEDPSTCQDAPETGTEPGPFILVSFLLFIGVVFLFITYLIGILFPANLSKFNVDQHFFLGARVDSRRERGMPARLLGRRTGSTQGLHGSAEALHESGGDCGTEEVQDCEGAEAAASSLLCQGGLG